MTAQLLDNRKRAIGLGAALAVHVIVIGLLLFLGPGRPFLPKPGAQFVAIALNAPPAPPPPDQAEQGAAAPPSRGEDKAPAPKPPPRPLPSPSPAQVPVDPGAAQGAGAGAAAGNGAGTAGSGLGSGSGGAGTGSGSGRITPPQRIAGELTNADYRRARAPEGAAGTVAVEFRVRTDGAADRCAVIGSSGVAAFDEATCRLIQQRFRFRPARAEDGRPVEWIIRTNYTWAPR